MRNPTRPFLEVLEVPETLEYQGFDIDIRREE